MQLNRIFINILPSHFPFCGFIRNNPLIDRFSITMLTPIFHCKSFVLMRFQRDLLQKFLLLSTLNFIIHIGIHLLFILFCVFITQMLCPFVIECRCVVQLNPNILQITPRTATVEVQCFWGLCFEIRCRCSYTLTKFCCFYIIKLPSVRHLCEGRITFCAIGVCVQYVPHWHATWRFVFAPKESQKQQRACSWNGARSTGKTRR